MYILQAQCLDSCFFLLLWPIMQKATELFLLSWKKKTEKLI